MVAVVDGSTSFIGIALIRELCSNGYKVYALIRPNSRRKAILSQIYGNRICILEIDISSEVHAQKDQLFALSQKLKEEVELTEYYHVAWSSDFENPRFNILGQMKNVEYTMNSIEIANSLGCRKFISIGSQAECGRVIVPINSDTQDNPITAYAEAKCETYRKGRMLSRELGIEFYWPRLLSAYGTYDRESTLVMSCINACIKKQSIPMTKAEQIWDYVYVNDVARALRLVAQKGQPLKKYTIASGVGRPLKEYIQIIADVYAYPDLMNGIGARPYSDNEVMYLVGDVSEIEADTGMMFNTNFDRVLREMRYTINVCQ